jgi:hypothetical protein
VFYYRRVASDEKKRENPECRKERRDVLQRERFHPNPPAGVGRRVLDYGKFYLEKDLKG